MKYLVIDTETTGLDNQAHELISLGAIVMIDNVIVQTIEIKVKPQRLQNADPKAMQVNGYSEYKWRKAIDPQLAANQIHAFFLNHQDATLVGHNVQFDIGFLKSFCSDHHIQIKIPTPYLDTRDICRATLAPFGLASMSLDNICAFLGWQRRKAHTALSDCEDCIKILRCLAPPSTRFMLRLHTMKKIREIKGLLS